MNQKMFLCSDDSEGQCFIVLAPSFEEARRKILGRLLPDVNEIVKSRNKHYEMIAEYYWRIDSTFIEPIVTNADEVWQEILDNLSVVEIENDIYQIDV